MADWTQYRQWREQQLILAVLRRKQQGDETMDDTLMIKGCVNVGNARTKAVFVGPDGQQRPVMLPSVKSISGANLFALRQHRTLGADDHVLTWSHGKITEDEYIGALALSTDVEAANARGSRRRGADGWNLSFVLASAKAAYPTAHAISLDLVTCVPASWWTPELATATEAALKGTWTFVYNGQDKPTTVKIASVRVEREGYLSYFAPGVDKPAGRVLILNGGGDTWNICEVLNGVLGNHKTLNKMGVEVVYDEVDGYLLSQGKRAMTLAERYALSDALRQGATPFAITVGHKPYRVDDIARDALDAKASKLVQLLSQAIPDMGAYDQVYVVGGAAYTGLMGEQIARLRPTFTIPAGALERTDDLGGLALMGEAVKPLKRKK